MIAPAYEDVRSCAERSAKKRGTGVVAVARGNESNAAVILECMRQGLVNTVILDQVVAKHFVNIVG